jgi:hypothetical protein
MVTLVLMPASLTQGKDIENEQSRPDKGGEEMNASDSSVSIKFLANVSGSDTSGPIWFCLLGCVFG